jgi:hypothetical protein
MDPWERGPLSNLQIDYLRTLLMSKGHADESTFSEWERQWATTAQSHSSFVEYLVRIGVLNQRAVTVLPMMIKGYANVPLSTLLGTTLASSLGTTPSTNIAALAPGAIMTAVEPGAHHESNQRPLESVVTPSVDSPTSTLPTQARHTGSMTAVSTSSAVSRPIRADNAPGVTKASRKTDVGFPALQMPVVRVPIPPSAVPTSVPLSNPASLVRVPTAPVLPAAGSPIAQRVVNIPKRQTITASWDVPTDMDIAALEESSNVQNASVVTMIAGEVEAEPTIVEPRSAAPAQWTVSVESAGDGQHNGVPIEIDVTQLDGTASAIDENSTAPASSEAISPSISASVAAFISPPVPVATKRLKMVSLAPANQQVEAEGTAVGQFAVGRVIRARGGSVVYEAFQNDSSVPVSLTMLRRLADHDTRALLARLARELPALATAKSPCLVNTIAHGNHNGSIYIASIDTPEFTARAIVEQFGPVPADRVFAMGNVVATTLRDNAHLPVLWPALGPDDIMIHGSDLSPQLMVPALALRGSAAIIRYADRLQNLGVTLSYLIAGGADDIDKAVDGLAVGPASALIALVNGDTRKLPTWTAVEVALRL